MPADSDERPRRQRRPQQRRQRKSPRAVVGWREWVTLPELGIETIKAKIDTGARSSALHAFDVEVFRRDGVERVRFKVHPYQRDSSVTIRAEGEVVDHRSVRSSSGHESLRPVIVTEVEMMGHRWPIEITLTNRDAMGFRMLLSRQAVRRRFLVDPGRSFLGGKRPPASDREKKSGKRRGGRRSRADER